MIRPEAHQTTEAVVNRLYYGDCLTIMQDWPNACVDLIYLDPPFNSNRQYNSIYKDETGHPLPDQIDAFCDMWELDPERERAIRAMPVLMRENGIDDSIVEFWKLWMQALRGTQPRLLAYLSYMAQRLLIMKRILKPTGSIYLHCDPTASHYVKALMDAIFGHENFRNEIVWRYSGWNARLNHNFNSRHDTLLLYSKGKRPTFNSYAEPWADEAEYLKVRKQKRRVDEEGRAFVLSDGGNGKRVRRYLDEAMQYGKPASDVWSIDKINNSAREHMGYATQKPLALMERIIQASSNPGDVVLDPFCGCATTLEAAHRLDREWIGIDIAIHAIKRVASVRLQERMGLQEGEDFTVEGVPRDLEGAQDLWRKDKYHFQKWAVEQADGFVTTKRSADGGVDGRIYFAVPNERELQSMVVEVKGGANVGINVLRELQGVLDNDTALMAGLIIMEPLGLVKERNFQRFMADAGMIDLWGNEYPRLQLLTVSEILNGQRFQTPTVAGRHEQNPRLPGLPV